LREPTVWAELICCAQNGAYWEDQGSFELHWLLSLLAFDGIGDRALQNDTLVLLN